MTGHSSRARLSDRRTAARRTAAFAALALTLALPATAAAQSGPAPVLLGTSENFAVLAGSGMTNTGTSTITGDVGSTPTHSQSGFGPCPAANCVNLTGTNHNDPDPNDAVTQQAKSDATTAYGDAFNRTGGTAVVGPLGGGMTLVPGLYTSPTDLFVGGDLTLDGGGDPSSVFIFQAKTSTLVTAAGITSGIPNTRVLLANGAQACNVFWQVGSSATISTFTQFVGTILANQSITVNTSATLETGRVLALNGAVTLDTNTITKAACAPPVGAGGGGGGGSGADTGTPTPGPGSGTQDATAQPATTSPVAQPTPGLPADPPRPSTGHARLTGPTGPVFGPFTVTVTGRAIKSVAYYLDGRRIGTVHSKAGRTKFKVRIDPRRQSRRAHRIVARVTFTAGSRTTARSLRLVYRRGVTQRQIRFTG